jgi:hypothetical protein
LRLSFGEREHRCAQIRADMQRARVGALDPLIGAWLADRETDARRARN